MLLRFFKKKRIDGMAKNKNIEDMTVEKINKINTLLLNGASLNQLDKQGVLELSRKAFKNRALKIGYIYDDNLKQFILSDNNACVTPSNTNMLQDNSKKTPPTPNQRKSEPKVVLNNFEYDLEDIFKRLEKLEKLVLQNNTNVTPPFELHEISLGKITSRSFKLSKKSLELFDIVCKQRFPEYSKQHLLSQALIEFVQKYQHKRD